MGRLKQQVAEKEDFEEEEDEEEENVIEEDEALDNCPIDDLSEHGITAIDIQKLKNGGLVTVKGLLMRTRKEISAIKGISEGKLDKIMEAATKALGDGSHIFITGSDALERRMKMNRLTTGSRGLDEILGGGIETMSITEIFGEFRTGKTQICHTLSVTSQLPISQGGLNGKTIWIDTEGTFRPERCASIALRYGLEPKTVLDNILIARAYTHETQMDIIEQAAAIICESPIRLLVLDSATSLFRVDFSGRGELSERQQKLGKMLSSLVKLAEEFNIAVVIVNQVVADPGASMFASSLPKPIGGHVLAHSSCTRLSLRKGRGNERIAKIYDSPSVAESECVFTIAENGITDGEE